LPVPAFGLTIAPPLPSPPLVFGAPAPGCGEPAPPVMSPPPLGDVEPAEPPLSLDEYEPHAKKPAASETTATGARTNEPSFFIADAPVR
jgi:hypothetical protein